MDMKGTVFLSTRFDTHASQVVFSCKDTGPGISKKQSARLFNAFQQAATETSRKHGGTGLGLVICKGIAEGLKGKIWLESEPGKGTSFFIYLPAPEKKIVLEEITKSKR